MKMNVQKELYKLINNEVKRLNNNIILIGSANLPFRSVMQAYGLPLNYNPIERSDNSWISPGCEDCSKIYKTGNRLALNFFNNPKGYLVTLNPLSGTQSNQIVFNACLNNNDVVLTFNQICGGHVSNFAFIEKHFNIVLYGTRYDNTIDYEDITTKVYKYKPKLVIAGASSYPRMFNYQKLSSICKETGSLLLADIAHTGLYESANESSSSFGYADFISFTTHKATRGPRGGVLYYRTEFDAQIQASTYTITQCAPRYTDIICKSIMFSEWNTASKMKYIKSIHKISEFICNYMKINGEILYTDGTDIHYIVIDVSNKKFLAKDLQKMLNSIGILVDICYIPNCINCVRYNGLRIGVLMLATLNYTITDIQMICKIILEVINGNYNIKEQKKLTQELALKYSAIMAF